MSSEIFDWKPSAEPDTLSLSLTGIRLGPKQARRVNDWTASLSLAENDGRLQKFADHQIVC